MGKAWVILVSNRGAGSLGRVAAGTVTVGEVAALNHETANNTVERSTVVLALLGEFNEVCGAFADDIFENAQFHSTMIGLHDCDSFACFGFSQLIEHKISYR